MPEIDREGPITLAAALCYLAASTHSTNATEQQQLAAGFFSDCMSGFKGVDVSENVEKLLCELIKKAGHK